MCGPVSWLRARCDVGKPGLERPWVEVFSAAADRAKRGSQRLLPASGCRARAAGAAGGLIQGVTRPDVICQLPRTTLAASGREQREVEGV